jgi:O-acetylserine/cysteine efflux transporter
MSGRDFALLALVCFVWGVNLPLTKWVVEDIPPIFVAALRFIGIAMLLAPFLRPIPRQIGLVLLVALCVGGVHFALLFLGLANAPASAAAIVGQLGLPFSTILSVIFLNEVVRWRRALGIALSFAGVVVIAYDPSSFGLSVGLLYIAASALVASIGGVWMKRMEPLPALNLQAWVGLFSIAPALAASAMFETGQVESLAAAGPMAWAAIGFSILVVSIFGHAVYYTLLKRYDVTLLAPLTLMTPVWAVVIGILALGEPVTGKLLLGGALTLAGVALIAVRRNAVLPPEALARAKPPA